MKSFMQKLVFILPLLVGAVALGALLLRDDPAPQAETLTGMVEATEVDVVPKIPGRVASVLVAEGERVQRGQLVAVLESKEIDAKVAQAEGALKSAESRLMLAHNGPRPEEREAARRLFLTAQHNFELAEKTYQRVQRVFDEGVVSAQERDQAQARYDAAREQMEAARAQYTIAQKGARVEDVMAAEGLVQQGRNAVAEARAYQGETRLYSPVDGEVSRRVADPGEVVAAGYPVLTVLQPTDSWVVLQVREDQLAAFRMGTTVKGVLPGLGGRTASFRVAEIAPMADFATWRATGQKGDFDLKTFELHLRPTAPIDGLRPGMTVRIAR